MAVSENSYSSIGRVPGRLRGNSPEARPADTLRWRIMAARGELQRAAAVTAATWVRARNAVAGLLYDR